LRQAAPRLAFIGREGGDIHQPGNLRIVAGFGDHYAAVGMANQQNWTILRVD